MSEKYRNMNILKNIHCSNCRSLGPFIIRGTATFIVDDEGAEPCKQTEFEWEDGDFIECCNCHYSSKLRNFKTKNVLGKARCPVPACKGKNLILLLERRIHIEFSLPYVTKPIVNDETRCRCESCGWEGQLWEALLKDQAVLKEKLELK